MSYRETMNSLNDRLKNKSALRKFAQLDLFGAVSLLYGIKSGVYAPSIGSFSLVILLTTALYHLEKIKLKVESLEKRREAHQKEYLELKELYNQYLDELAEIILKCDIENDIELIGMIQFLLMSGNLSSNKSFTFDGFDESDELFEDLIGTYVMCGNGVCRHISSFASDLLTNLNVKNFKIYTTSLDGKITRRRPTHVVTGLIYDNKKLVYDFTNLRPGFINDDDTIVFPENGLLTSSTKKIVRNYFGISLDYPLEFDELESYELNDSSLWRYLISGSLKGRMLDEFGHVYERKKDLIEAISEKSLRLMPRK